MTPYYSDDQVTIYHGDCREVLPSLSDVEVLVTDPPYGDREDLFATDAVEDALDATSSLPGFVFWPCMGELPRRSPDAVHIWYKAVPIHPKSTTGNVAGHHYERILGYGTGRRCEVFHIAAIMPNFAACRREVVAHPTQKPLDLLVRLISRTPTGTIVDPFMGSGSTLRAAKDLGRRVIGVETDERYCEIAAGRMAQGVLAFS